MPPDQPESMLHFIVMAVVVSLCSTHVGHDLDLAHIPLHIDERKHLASKIAHKIPFDDILNIVQNTVQD